MRFAAAAEETGERLDVVVARRYEVSRSAAQEAIRSGAVTVNGAPERPSYRLAAGDDVAGEVVIEETAPPLPESIPLDIRYSDDRMFVVSKPAGLVTHPASGHASGTLVNALLGLGIPLGRSESDRPGIVHRLDKDTSGLLLVARDDEAHAFLSAALRRRAIHRTYVALVRGTMPAASGTIDAPLGRNPVARRKIAVVPEGRSAVTHYKVLDHGEAGSLLEVRLETGRTHQIRVHLAYLRHPVLGDPVYGGKSDLSKRLGLRRPFLHAARLEIPHPDSGEMVVVEDPLPKDLEEVIRAAGLSL